MTPDEFVAALKDHVFDASVDTVRSVLLDGPPGRRPHERSIALHDWFVHLDIQSQRLVLEVARDAAHAALFGMLCVLDGVRVVDPPPHEHFILVSQDDDGTETLLNPEGSDLHDRLNRIVHPPSEALPRE